MYIQYYMYTQENRKINKFSAFILTFFIRCRSLSIDYDTD